MLDLRDGRISDQLLQGEDSAKALIIVNYIDVIDLIHVFSLLAHLVDTFGHTPILVHHDHFGTHQSTGSVFIVFQEVDDVARLFYVFDVRKNLFLGIFVQLTHQVYSVVGLHIVHEAFGNQFVRKFFQQLVTVFFIQFHQNIRCLFAIHQQIEVDSFLQIKLLVQLGYVRRIQFVQYLLNLSIILLRDDVF